MPKKVEESEQMKRLKAAKTVQELRAALSGMEPLDVQSAEVQAEIARVTGG